jgi:hypothetical protein
MPKLQSVPDYATRCRFLKRRDDPTIDQALREAARRMGNTNRARRRARIAAGLPGTIIV